MKQNIDSIKTVFVETFGNLGYEITEGVKPYPSVDSSVLFIGAQSSIWKPVFLDENTNNKLTASVQKCIRTKNLKEFFKKEPNISYLTTFEMLGSLATGNSFDKQLESVYILLNNLGVDIGRFAIRSNKNLLNNHRSLDQFPLFIDTEEPAYYEWNYGDDRLTGEGVTLLLKNENNGSFCTMGNIIDVKKDQTAVAVEYGVGIEKLLVAIDSRDAPIETRDAPEIFRAIDIDDNEILVNDAIIGVIEMMNLGIYPGRRGASAVCKSYLYAIAYHSMVSNCPIKELESRVKQYIDHKEYDSELYIKVTEVIEKAIGRLEYFIYLKNKKTLSQEEDNFISKSFIGRIILNNYLSETVKG